MKDAEFEKTSDQWAAICVAVADTVKKIDISDDGGWVFPKEVTFKTHSLGFSNIGMLYYSKKQEREFNDRYLKYLREFAK